uniref:Uncharacterized protein n=1 Tax=Romanomermis culicivorax TaxID=13658 RepID=A0A915IA44_ROMCU
MLRHFTTVRKFRMNVSEVDLNDQVNEAVVFIARDGSVRANDQFAVYMGAKLIRLHMNSVNIQQTRIWQHKR